MTLKIQSNVQIECDECHKGKFVTYWLTPGITREEIVDVFRQDSKEWGWSMYNGFIFCGNFCKEEFINKMQ